MFVLARFSYRGQQLLALPHRSGNCFLLFEFTPDHIQLFRADNGTDWSCL